MNDDRLSPEIRRVAIVVIVGAIMSILDTTIVNVALESLARDLDAPLSTIQWVATGYLLSLATVIPLTGWAAERFGPRRVWMTVVAGFVVTSALCALAWSAESLIAFRVLQGLAGGMIMPIGMITLAQTAGPSRVGRVMSVIGVPMLLAPVLGPVLGGLIVTHLSWRWIFLVNLPIGVVGLVLAAKLMPAGRSIGRGGEGAPSKLDWKGLLLLSPGLALARVRAQRGLDARQPDARAAASRGRRPRPGRRLRLARVAHRLAARRRAGCSAAAASPPRARRSSSSAGRCSARCSCCRSTTRWGAASRRWWPACSWRRRASGRRSG